ncbi:MAG: SDR family oxidoreductase [Acidobacteria bacterium]|nr:SDR family oxidoreductase [Acidobacteriota bacterium]
MRRAIATGGTRGIGRSIARAILASGGRVMITGVDTGRIEQAVRVLGEDSGRPDDVAGALADVRDPVAVDRAVQEAVSRFGAIDTLVNNAGIGVFSEVAAMTDADWHRVMNTNLTGAFYCTRAVIPAMRRAGGGWIVNIASLAGRNPFAGGAAYCASKAAVIAFSEALMQEVRYDGIRVTVVMPGSVATEFSGRMVTPEDAWKLSPDDVAEAVMDLFRHPGRSLPSRIEIRPAQPKSRS